MKPEDSSKKVLIILIAILFSCLTFYFATPTLIDQDKYRNLFHRLEVYQEFGKTENNNENKKPSHYEYRSDLQQCDSGGTHDGDRLRVVF